MKTIFGIVLAAAACCGAFLATDIVRSVEKGVNERKEFVASCDQYNIEQQTGVHIYTSGILANEIDFDMPAQMSNDEIDYIWDETLYGRESAEDINFREALRRMHFERIRVGTRVANVPKAEPVGKHGGEQYEFADLFALKCTGFGAV